MVVVVVLLLLLLLISRMHDDDGDDNADFIDHGNDNNGDTDGDCHTFCFVCKPRPRDGVIMRNSSGMGLSKCRELMAMCRV